MPTDDLRAAAEAALALLEHMFGLSPNRPTQIETVTRLRAALSQPPDDGEVVTAWDVAELQADARRYRWLRNNQALYLRWLALPDDLHNWSADALDESIDAAMGGTDD